MGSRHNQLQKIGSLFLVLILIVPSSSQGIAWEESSHDFFTCGEDRLEPGWLTGQHPLPASLRSNFSIEFWFRSQQPLQGSFLSGTMTPFAMVQLGTALEYRKGSVSLKFGGFQEYPGLSLGTLEHVGLAEKPEWVAYDPSDLNPNCTNDVVMECVARAFPLYTLTTDWYHIAGTFDGNYCRVYVNGVIKHSQLLNMPAPPSSTPFTDISILASANVTIAEVRLWSGARTSKQIRDTKDSRLDVSLLSGEEQSSLLGLWRSLDAAGSLADASGHGRNLLQNLTGRVTWPIQNASLQSFPPQLETNQVPVLPSMCKQTPGECFQFSESYWRWYPISNDKFNFGEAITFLKPIMERVLGTCFATAIKYYCNVYYPPCAETLVQVEPVLQGLHPAEWNFTDKAQLTDQFVMTAAAVPCKGNCLNFVDKCSPFEAVTKREIAKWKGLLGSSLSFDFDDLEEYLFPCPNCSCPDKMTYPVRGVPYVASVSLRQYVSTSLLKKVNGSCTGDQNKQHLTTPEQFCKFPLTPAKLNPALVIEFQTCKIQECPAPIMSTTDFSNLKIFFGVSSVTLLVVSLTHFLVSKSQNDFSFPKNLLLLYGVCACAKCFAAALSVIAFSQTNQTLLCNDDEGTQMAPSAFSNGFCAFQAITIHFFGIASLFFWAGLCHNVYITARDVVTISTREIYSRRYVAVPFVIGLLSVVILLATENLGLTLVGTVCWISNPTIEWVAYWIPLGMVLLFSVFVTASIRWRFKAKIGVLHIPLACMIITGCLTLLCSIHVALRLSSYRKEIEAFETCNNDYLATVAGTALKGVFDRNRGLVDSLGANPCQQPAGQFIEEIVFFGQFMFTADCLVLLVISSTRRMKKLLNARKTGNTTIGIASPRQQSVRLSPNPLTWIRTWHRSANVLHQERPSSSNLGGRRSKKSMKGTRSKFSRPEIELRAANQPTLGSPVSSKGFS
mmetsp:Transcript_16752/g.23510  ORF Transcript_16752/g.23510 Transcript_16752/m.23510 type:complete len:955 (-) Transcript_16752:208-3072(-)